MIMWLSLKEESDSNNSKADLIKNFLYNWRGEEKVNANRQWEIYISPWTRLCSETRLLPILHYQYWDYRLD